MKKHAFLVMAYTSMEDLIVCCKSIDAINHDIFLHIDKKWKNFSKQTILREIKNSNVHFIERRLDIKWGGQSSIFAEVILLKQASLGGGYDYYHFMSGMDMIIQTLDQFDNFFENKDNEFLSFCGKDWNELAKNRLKYFHVEAGRNKFLRIVNKAYIILQKIIRVNRLKKIRNYEIVGGSNWCSISHDFAKYIIENEELIHKIFKHSFCADELFIHMLAYNSSFRKKIYLLKILEKNNDSDSDMYKANMRFIDWSRGNPYVFQNEDYEQLISCHYLIARKFRISKENNVSLKVLEFVKNIKN